MSEKRFQKTRIVDKWGGIYDSQTDRILDVNDVEHKLNEQQATISALKDILKDIVTYSEWDSEKPYCSLGITIDKKTYYKIREILNE